jgi:hypothetical protein
MSSRLLAVGVALAIPASGCGEQGHSGQPAPPGIQAEVSHIITSPVYRSQGYEFPGVEPGQLEHVASFSVRAAGVERTDSAYAEHFPTDTAKQATDLYVEAQVGEMNFAQRFPSIRLPLLSHDRKGSAGWLKTQMTTTRSPSVLVLTGSKDFSSSVSKQVNDHPAAATFYPSVSMKQTDTLSFVGAIEGAPYNTVAIGVEACQASVHIETGSSTTQITAQEIICNSLGTAYSFALRKASYESYTKYADTKTPRVNLPDGRRYLKFFVLPKTTYGEIEAGKIPDTAQGIRSAGYA